MGFGSLFLIRLGLASSLLSHQWENEKMVLLTRVIWFLKAGYVGHHLGMMNPWSDEAAMNSRLVSRNFLEAWFMIDQR